MDLIINSFGTTLTKDNDTFVILHEDGKQRVHPDGIKSISISKGAQITSDAAIMAIEHEIDVLFVDNTGRPVGRLWSHKYGSVSTIRRGQLDFSLSKNAITWIKGIVVSKLENQQAVLLTLRTKSPEEEAIVKKSLEGLRITAIRSSRYREKWFPMSPLPAGMGRSRFTHIL